MPASSAVDREMDGARAVYRLTGTFDRAGAWGLRDRIEREPAAEILLDFSLVRDFSDLAIAVLAHGLTAGTRRIRFRGLRQHQLRIFRYCGVITNELPARVDVDVAPSAAPEGRWTSEIQ